MARDLGELEVALQERWDDETAAVYADALIARGDPRGEVIAIDLHIARHGKTDELARRRKAQVTAWLGENAWCDDGFGYTRNVASELKDIRRVRQATYLRSFVIYDHHAPLDALLQALEAVPLPWLRRLTLHKTKRKPISPAALEVLAAAAPHLEELALDGDRVCEAPPLPGVRTLRLTGCRALIGATPMPQVTELDVELWRDPRFTERGERGLTQLAKALKLERFPALARLDLARNEYPYSVPAPDDYSCFPLLRALAATGVLAPIPWLRTPALRGDADHAIALELLAQHPGLELHLARTYDYAPPASAAHPRLHIPAQRPWPAQREVPVRSDLLVSPIDLGDSSISLFRCIDALEQQFDAMLPAAQDAWRAVWRFLDGLEWAADDADEIEMPFDAATLLTALDALDDELGSCERFAEALRQLQLPPGATVGIQRYWTG
jgi:hypothetical protein